MEKQDACRNVPNGSVARMTYYSLNLRNSRFRRTNCHSIGFYSNFNEWLCLYYEISNAAYYFSILEICAMNYITVLVNL